MGLIRPYQRRVGVGDTMPVTVLTAPLDRVIRVLDVAPASV